MIRNDQSDCEDGGVGLPFRLRDIYYDLLSPRHNSNP